jgi:hypothetical protein
MTFAATEVTCTLEGNKFIITKTGDQEYTLNIDEKLSSRYLGEVGKDLELPEYASTVKEKNKNRLTVASGDGNYWINAYV